MIYRKRDTLMVEFGHGSLMSRIENWQVKETGKPTTALVIQECEAVGVGEKAPEEFDITKPKVTLMFLNVESIEAFENALADVKKNLKEAIKLTAESGEKN